MPFLPIPGSPEQYALINFDDKGAERPEGGELFTRTLIERAKQEQPTNIFFFSHGWKGDVPAAIDQYNRWIGAMVKQTADREKMGPAFKPMWIGLHWPSQPFGEEGTAGGVNFAASGAGDNAELEAAVAHFGGTAAVRQPLEVIFKAAIDHAGEAVVPAYVNQAYKDLADAIGFEGGESASAAPDREGAKLDPQGALEMESGEGAEFGLVDKVLSGLKGGLRQLSFWTMKKRARTVGEGGMHAFIAELMQQTNAKIHLMGHSFGCIVTASILGGPNGKTPLPRAVNSVALVQGAVSLWSWAAAGNVPDSVNPGYFHNILTAKCVSGPVITTHSVKDLAVGVLYPAAVSISGSPEFGPGQKFPKQGGIGMYGIQGTVVESLAMLDVDGNYPFAGGKIYNLKSDAFIKKMDGASGAHSDIDGPQVAHAIWQAALASRTRRRLTMANEAVRRATEFPDEELALPFGVTGKGEYLNRPAEDAWDKRDPVPKEVEDRMRGQKHLLPAQGVDPLNLASAGWGVVYAEGTDPAVKEALKPLIEHRREQVGAATQRFQVFDEEDGRAVRPAQTGKGWLTSRRVGMFPVVPDSGVPLYLLLVGPPTGISFDFQYAVDSYWNVGRLDFDQPEHYAAYAQQVIEYEKAATIRNKKTAVLWNVKNAGDVATALLHNQVGQPLLNGTGGQAPLGEAAGFTRQALMADAATKSALIDALKDGTASFLFTGSHGMGFPDLDETKRRELQGALLCQEWTKGDDTTPDHYLTGDEVLAHANVSGMIHFLFACYGGGCPALDDYARDSDGKRVQLMKNPVTARVPQAMLRKGALAVMAHIDRAWSYSFQGQGGLGQYQGFRSVMDDILTGTPIGQATDIFNQQWSQRSAELADYIELRNEGEPIPDKFLTNRWVERNDARNYVILGDPAVRLRVDKM